MTELAQSNVSASVGRALWGEVAPNLRSVRFRATEHGIELRFYYEGDAGESERDAMGSVGAEVAADFPDTTISEEAVATSADNEIPCQDGWHTAYARKEPSLAR
jgi:hypothetical protein